MSSNGGRGSGIGDRDRLDEAIDRAVREMLDVEPPAGLRGRVLDRIDALSGNPLLSTNSVVSAFRRNTRKTWWLAGPVAAAAVVVLAVLALWRGATEIEGPPFTSRGDTRLAVESAPPPSIVTPGPAAPIQVASVQSRAPRRGGIRAADAAGDDVNFTAVETVQALAGPESIAVPRLADAPPPALPSIEPAPLQIRALQVSALPETPRERREE
jgi:hypothetical protein